MASGASAMDRQPTRHPTGLLSGKRGRILKENLTAYLFLSPAMSLIFVFGLFPVAFALYVSMYKWKIKQSTFRGLSNYTKALDNLAYVIAFLIAVGAIWLAVSYLRKVWKKAQETNETPWLLAIPGALLAGSLYKWLVFAVLVLPEVLNIGEKVQRLEKTRKLYVQLFQEAFRVETVMQARQQAVWLLVGGVVLWILIARLLKNRHATHYVSQFFMATFFALSGYLIGRFIVSNIQLEYAKAVEKNVEINTWPQVVFIIAGLILLYFGWRMWNSAARQPGSAHMALRLLAGIMLLAAAWMLIGELPAVFASGDKDMWRGLLVTTWYSMGTVPIQLALGLAIAYLLYQEIRAKSFFRMVYFLPYITPAVASAAVFRIMFSNRPTGMMNNLLNVFGIKPLKWLLEPNSIFKIGSLAGPSLALVVIIMFGIWTYSGYNAVIFLAGLGGIPRSLYEAAEIDGASRWQSFRHITLPLLSPITYFLSLLGVIGTFKAFNHVFVLRNAGALRTVDTMSMVIWDLIKADSRYGYGSTMAFVLFGVVLALTLVNNKLQGEKVFYG